ncbi:MAG: hypothetical protein A2Z20_09100 [Bdellovibrionales bacterium RBG_16_40_8]|nr:MAG: hypothetical protein A2Z20_09100 [Bdellovibrionales bacterium RBG_16_40_8]
MTRKIASKRGIFGLETIKQRSHVILTPVPWEVTTSYGSGTSLGPQAILDASSQLDLFDLERGRATSGEVHLELEDPFFYQQNKKLKILAKKIISELDQFGELSTKSSSNLKKINLECAKMVRLIYEKTQAILRENKIPGLIGGDHSTSLGAIQAVSELFKGDIGVLHIDAHADLRSSYQGFQYSHASIMHNVCSLKIGPKKLVQVGIRDFCEEEFEYIKKNKMRIATYFDQHLKKSLFSGQAWNALCEKIISELPQNVYISFDIDGLSPEFCPHTGTPVPGGLSFDQAIYLLGALGRSGRKIVGFDLTEVAPGPSGEWDANVGARILFALCGLTEPPDQI